MIVRILRSYVTLTICAILITAAAVMALTPHGDSKACCKRKPSTTTIPTTMVKKISSTNPQAMDHTRGLDACPRVQWARAKRDSMKFNLTANFVNNYNSVVSKFSGPTFPPGPYDEPYCECEFHCIIN